MKKYITLFVLLVFQMQMAQERLYIDRIGNPVEKDKAKFYREIVQKDSLYLMKDYYLDGKLQMEAYSKYNNIRSIEDIEGKYIFYHPNGAIQAKGEVREGMKVGLNENFDLQGRLLYQEQMDSVGIVQIKRYAYKEGEEPFNQLMISHRDGLQKHIFYDQDITKIRYEIIWQDSTSVTIFYDQAGQRIGQAEYSKVDNTLKGIVVEYYSDPMKIKSIKYYNDKGEIQKNEIFYANGKLFARQESPNLMHFFNEKGNKIGEVQFTPIETEGNLYEQGTLFELNEKGILDTKTEFMLSFPTEKVFFYNNGKVKSILKYNLEGLPKIVTFFDQKGKTLSEVSYIEGSPYEGTLYIDLDKNQAHSTYKEGQLVLQENYDLQKVLRFRRKLVDSQKNHYLNELFDDKGNKTYEYLHQVREDILEITSFANSKPIAKAIFVEGIITSGSLAYKRTDFDKSYSIEVSYADGWITQKYYQDGKFIQEFRYDGLYARDARPYDIILQEKALSEYNHLPLY